MSFSNLYYRKIKALWYDWSKEIERESCWVSIHCCMITSYRVTVSTTPPSRPPSTASPRKLVMTHLFEPSSSSWPLSHWLTVPFNHHPHLLKSSCDSLNQNPSRGPLIPPPLPHLHLPSLSLLSLPPPRTSYDWQFPLRLMRGGHTDL